MGLVKSGQPAPMEMQRYFFEQFDGIDVDKIIGQLNPQGQPGAGQNPQQPVPPAIAAQMMVKGGQQQFSRMV